VTLGYDVVEVDPDLDREAIIAAHRVVMLFEAAQHHGHLLRSAPEALGPQIRRGLAEGVGISEAEASAARRAIADTRDRVWDALDDLDALLLQPVPSAAPEGLGSTGDQSYLTPWTALHGPLVVVPGRLDAAGLPLATMIGSAPGRDGLALSIAADLEAAIDVLPDYVAAPGASAK